MMKETVAGLRVEEKMIRNREHSDGDRSEPG